MSIEARLRAPGGATRTVAAGAAAAVLLAAWGATGGERAAGIAIAGWIVGLLFWLGIALGAFSLLAVHAVTGGRWLDTLRPVLAPATATLPLFVLLALPVLFDPGAVFPWAADPSVVRHDAVVRWYLNLPGFALRGAVALLGWSVLAVLLLRPGGARRPGLGGVALIFHAFAITAIGVDWVLSIEPHFRSTVFGAALAVSQVLAALAWCALLRPEPPGTVAAAGDLARMIIAAALGAVYLGYAQFLVAWYGNLPDKAVWFLRREAAPWIWLEAASLLLTALLPIGALLPRWMRRDPRALARIGGGLLLGSARSRRRRSRRAGARTGRHRRRRRRSRAPPGGRRGYRRRRRRRRWRSPPPRPRRIGASAPRNRRDGTRPAHGRPSRAAPRPGW